MLLAMSKRLGCRATFALLLVFSALALKFKFATEHHGKRGACCPAKVQVDCRSACRSGGPGVPFCPSSDASRWLLETDQRFTVASRH